MLMMMLKVCESSCPKSQTSLFINFSRFFQAKYLLSTSACRSPSILAKLSQVTSSMPQLKKILMRIKASVVCCKQWNDYDMQCNTGMIRSCIIIFKISRMFSQGVALA